MILMGLFFLVLMQICSRGGQVERSLPVHDNNQSDVVAEDTLLRPLDELYYEELAKEGKKRNPETINLLILIMLVLLVFVATKRGWLNKLSPSFVWLGLSVKRNKTSKARIATILIRNHTKESLTFLPPVMVFSAPFKKVRKFRIKGGDGSHVFPLTLMPGTEHRLRIDIDGLRQKANIHKSCRWMRVEVNAGLKDYASLWRYLF